MNHSEMELLPNLGAVMAKKLAQAGIETPEQLREMGARQAWLCIRRQVDPGICLSALQALEGAVRGVRWHDLPTETKQELREFYKRESKK